MDSRAVASQPTAAVGTESRRSRILSLSTEFPNPSEPAKGLFVRARIMAMAEKADVTVVAPVAMVDYANPQNRLLAAFAVPPSRRDNGVEVLHPRWLYPPYGGWTNAFFLFARLIALGRVRQHDTFDVIDAHFAHPEGIAAALLSAVLNVPFTVTLRGSELRYRHQRLKRFWMGWALRRANRVIAVSDGLRQLAVDLGVEAGRAKTIPNGIDADLFFRRDRLTCRRAHGIDDEQRVILSAGDLAELKGHQKIVRALTDLHPHVVLLIAGGVGRSGRYADELRKQVKAYDLEKRVRFLGEVEQHALAELMCAADVFCLASSTEGWPNVVNEALACGTPVVATNVGAVSQMIPSTRYGFIVPVDGGPPLVEALERALRQDWDHAAISEWGRSRSWCDVADDVLDGVREIARR